MQSGIIFASLFFLVVVSLTNFSHAYQTEIGDDVFIFVQTTVRNADGQLVAYLESSKFTDINFEELDPFLDRETSMEDDPIITLNGDEYQVIRRIQTKTISADDLAASTILYDTIDGKSVVIARFAHDGYQVSSGDTVESLWTFIRPVS